jgi:hypothetical protein
MALAQKFSLTAVRARRQTIRAVYWIDQLEYYDLPLYDFFNLGG